VARVLRNGTGRATVLAAEEELRGEINRRSSGGRRHETSSQRAKPPCSASSANAGILDHNNPAQRIVYLDRVAFVRLATVSVTHQLRSPALTHKLANMDSDPFGHTLFF